VLEDIVKEQTVLPTFRRHLLSQPAWPSDYNPANTYYRSHRGRWNHLNLFRQMTISGKWKRQILVVNFSETSALPHNSTQCRHPHQNWAQIQNSEHNQTYRWTEGNTESCGSKSVARILMTSRQEERTASAAGQLDYTTVLVSLSSDGVRSVLKTIHTVLVFSNKRTLSDFNTR
jgi:hypothetical protein